MLQKNSKNFNFNQFILILIKILHHNKILQDKS